MRLVALAVVIVILTPTAAAADPSDPPARPYTTPLTPTGELLHRGEFQRSWNVALEGEVAVGITDRVELRLQGHPVLTGDLQLRIAVLPRSSRAQIVVGGDVAGTLLDGPKAWLGASLAVAYRDDDWQVHATTRIAEQHGAGTDLAQTTAGLMGFFGDRNLLFVDVGEVAWRSPDGDVGRAHGVAFGVWWYGRELSYGLSAIVFRTGDTVIPILPLLSMSWSD